jgi:hypothetical protein
MLKFLGRLTLIEYMIIAVIIGIVISLFSEGVY